MGFYAEIIADKKRQIEKILGTPYDGRQFPSPDAYPGNALNPIADVKVLEAEARQMEIMDLVGRGASLTATQVPPEEHHLLAEYEELRKSIELWKPHMSTEKTRGG
jgi:hypothetical protein